MPPLVTIGIPCFNSAATLGAAIESALAQTWKPTKVIVVDDGSTDESASVARSFAPRVQLIPTANLGGNHARNCILEAASGEWLQFLDADDRLEPEKIAQQFVETEDGAQADVIYGPVFIERSDDAIGPRETTTIDPALDLYAQWIAWQLPQTGGGLWRRSALEAIGGWKEGQPCCQEHELYLRALKAGLRFVFAPTPHAVYRMTSEDTVCRRDPARVIAVRTSLIDDLREWLEARGKWTAVHRRIAGRACFEMARTLARDDLRKAADYHRDRASRGLIHLEGPAAPLAYRIAYRLAGFARAEQFALGLR
jgi:hypothetical protein